MLGGCDHAERRDRHLDVVAGVPGLCGGATVELGEGREPVRCAADDAVPASIAVRAIAEPTRPAPKTAIVVTVILSVGVKRG